jgi:hypothetical protein
MTAPASLPVDPALAEDDLTPPISAYALPGQGINNHTVGIHTGAGDFIWKLYQTTVPDEIDPWQIRRAFCQGYKQTSELTEIEIASIIELMFLRDAVAVIWWFGRDLEADGPVRLDRLRALRTTIQQRQSQAARFKAMFG